MIERYTVGTVVLYVPPRSDRKIQVRIKGKRKGYVETEGVDDGLHRSISPKQLFPLAFTI